MPKILFGKFWQIPQNFSWNLISTVLSRLIFLKFSILFPCFNIHIISIIFTRFDLKKYLYFLCASIPNAYVLEYFACPKHFFILKFRLKHHFYYSHAIKFLKKFHYFFKCSYVYCTYFRILYMSEIYVFLFLCNWQHFA